MLIQMAVENVFSFKEETVLSMRAVPGVDHPPGQVVDLPGVGGVLRVLALYGANASGKSNLVLAHRWLADLVKNGTRPGKPIALRPFKPGGAEQPSRWSYVLFLDGQLVHYGVVATATQIEQEWLIYEDASGEEAPFFEREGQEFSYGPAAGSDSERRAFLEFVAQGTRPEQPLLAEFGERNVSEVEALRKWFDWQPLLAHDDLQMIGILTVVEMMLCHPEYRRETEKLLGSVGTGIEEIRIDYAQDDIRRAAETVPGSEDYQRRFREWRKQGLVRISYITAQATRFEWNELSDGTRRLLELGPHWFVLTNQNKTQFLDELDRSLHTSLAQHLVASFHEAASRQSQLIFTTHDTNLLDAGLLGHDAIWFVEKDPATGSSRIYSLAEFDAAQLDQLTGNIEQGYLAGRFGAIPFSGDPARLAWTP